MAGPLKHPATRQVNFRLPWATWQRLSAAAGVLDLTQGAIVTAGIELYFKHLPPDRRKVIDEALALRAKP